MATEGRARKGIGSVETAVRLLRIIEQAPGPLSLTQIARAAEFQLSKTHHYLVSLVRSGLVAQASESGLYTLGGYALQLGVAALGRTDAGAATADAVRRLRDDTGHSAFFSLWGDGGPVVVHSEQGLRPFAVHVRVGTVLPLAGSATADAFFAWMPDADVERALAEAKGQRRASPTELARMRARTRKEGVAHQSNTRTPQVAALAAPVFSKGAAIAGVLTTIGFLGDFDDDPRSKDAQVLRRHAKRLGEALGFRAAPAA